MKSIKQHILIMACSFSLPVLAQTVHVDSNRIAYHNTIRVKNTTEQELFSRAQKAIAKYVAQQPTSVKTDSINTEASAKGVMKLNSPYHLVKTVEYTLQLTVKDGGYQYHIDSVSVKEKDRGGKTTVRPSEELLKSMDVSGPESAKMEKQLNEIDMNFQKLIELVNEEMKKG